MGMREAETHQPRRDRLVRLDPQHLIHQTRSFRAKPRPTSRRVCPEIRERNSPGSSAQRASRRRATAEPRVAVDEDVPARRRGEISEVDFLARARFAFSNVKRRATEGDESARRSGEDLESQRAYTHRAVIDGSGGGIAAVFAILDTPRRSPSVARISTLARATASAAGDDGRARA